MLCDDFLFATVAAEAVDEGVWEEVSKGRSAAHAEAARSAGALSAASGDPVPWAAGLVRSVVSGAAPIWMPMHELVASGITLLGGARGVRGLFGAQPSEKETLRIKRLGGLAYRILSGVVMADGAPGADERFLQQALLSAIGLPAAEEAALVAASASGGSLEVLGEVDAKSAAMMVRGAWHMALRDGLDLREEELIVKVASSLSLKPEELAAQRAAAESTIENTRRLGRSTIDILFWLLGDEVALAQGVSTTLATILLPGSDREAVLASLTKGAPPADVNRAALSKTARSAALGVAWLVALRTDPTLTRKATLAGRFDTIARALDSDGVKVRRLVEEAVERRLAAVVASI